METHVKSYMAENYNYAYYFVNSVIRFWFEAG